MTFSIKDVRYQLKRIPHVTPICLTEMEFQNSVYGYIISKYNNDPDPFTIPWREVIDIVCQDITDEINQYQPSISEIREAAEMNEFDLYGKRPSVIKRNQFYKSKK